MPTSPARALIPLAALLLAGCSSLYYSTMEIFGQEKRDILASRVQDGRDDQLEAKLQFQTTLQAFKAVTGFDGNDLEGRYDELSRELGRCETRAAAVHDRIESIVEVSDDLFREWEQENEQYTDADLRTRSERLRDETRARCDDLVAAMRKAEAKMQPVLGAFRDQVRFLKHNLNAQAVASLQDNVLEIEDDLAALIRDMEASIAEADAFIGTLG